MEPIGSIGEGKNVLVRSIGEAAAQVRGRRLQLRLSQDGLAQRAGVSRKWVYEFEAGKPHAEFGHLLRVLDALDLQLDVLPRSASSASAKGAANLDAIIERHRDG
jgi:transcriptional regulator with XRE-family HTH domain